MDLKDYLVAEFYKTLKPQTLRAIRARLEGCDWSEDALTAAVVLDCYFQQGMMLDTGDQSVHGPLERFIKEEFYTPIDEIKYDVALWSGKSSVFLARVDGKNRAVKNSYSEDNAVLFNFLQELKTTKALRGHPNIVYVHCGFRQRNNHVLVMDYYPISHHRFLEKPFSDVAEALRTLVGAVAHAHSLGIAHRDIKPDNIRFTRDGTLKLCDWDCASHADCRPPALTNPVCTRSYRAPEVFGSSDYDPFLLDAWSCGVVAVEFLTGENPFEGDTDEDVAKKIQSAALPGGLPGYVLGFLQKDPEKRLRISDAAKSFAERNGQQTVALVGF